MTDITPIITAIIGVIAAVLSAFVIPYLRVKLSAEKRNELMTMVEIAVMAAEQLTKAGVINKDERKNHVLDFLHKNGFDINMDEIEEMIESVVITLPPLLEK